MKKRTKSAATSLMVGCWINYANPSENEYEITAQEMPNGKWLCEIELPLIGKTVKSISTTEVNSIKNASDKAAKLIDEFMSANDDLKIENIFKGKGWVFNEDENGRLMSVSINPIKRARLGKRDKKQLEESIKTVKKAIAKINKVNGQSKGLFMQVLDKSLFDKDMCDDDIVKIISERFETIYGSSIFGVNWTIDGDNIIGIGYTLDK